MNSDDPISFGYKSSWLTIKSISTEQVLKYLPLENTRLENWASGLEEVGNGQTFISPSIDGWVFVVSEELPELGHPDTSGQFHWLMKTISKHFDDVQYFATNRTSEFHAWARYRAGVEELAFSAVDSEILVNRTSLETKESASDYRYFDINSDESNADGYWDREELCYPEEEHVMETAASWSINPCNIDKLNLPKSTGWLGNLVFNNELCDLTPRLTFT